MRLYTTPRFAPLPDTQRINWPSVADELHARPGEWAAVGTQDCGRHPLNRTKLAALGLECTSRSNGDGTWTIWMRGIEGWAPERVQPTKATLELVPMAPSRLGKIPCTYGGLGLHWARWFVYPVARDDVDGAEVLGACCDEHAPAGARRDPEVIRTVWDLSPAEVAAISGLPESMLDLGCPHEDPRAAKVAELEVTHKWIFGERRTVKAAA